MAEKKKVEGTSEKKKVTKKKITSTKKKAVKKPTVVDNLLPFIIFAKPDTSKENGYDIQEIYIHKSDYEALCIAEETIDKSIFCDKEGNSIDFSRYPINMEYFTNYIMTGSDKYVAGHDAYIILPSVGECSVYNYTAKHTFNMDEYNVSIYAYSKLASIACVRSLTNESFIAKIFSGIVDKSSEEQVPNMETTEGE